MSISWFGAVRVLEPVVFELLTGQSALCIATCDVQLCMHCVRVNGGGGVVLVTSFVVENGVPALVS